MTFNNLVYWYQKKIGTYDKQQWEKTIEQKIFYGFTHVPMRTAKLKTEFIDVDLVRGSSFPKAKPKHRLGTIIYLAIQRLLFLPFNAHWWIQQTSPRIYIFFLLLYGLQILNIYIYFNHFLKEIESEIVSMSEVLIPGVMMLTLCMVHSQIVSTNCAPLISKKYERQRIRHSRHGRSRANKTRTRRNIFDNKESKAAQNSTLEKTNVLETEVSPSVRFAKKIIIETSPIASTSDQILEFNTSLSDSRQNSITSLQHFIEAEKLEEIEELVSVVNLESNQENDDVVHHQDDDGFESLNGNVSSDNDRDQMKIENKEKEVTENEATAQEHSHCDLTAPEVSVKREEFHDSEEDECDSPDSNRLSIQSSRDDRKESASEEEGECEETITNHLIEATTSATEWMGVTTNSDECSYSSEIEESDRHSEADANGEYIEHPFSWEFELPSSTILNSNYTSSDRVSCTIWTHRDVKKAELSVFDISSAIIARVESMPESMDYFYSGFILAIVLSLVPCLRRLSDHFGVDFVNNSSSINTELSLVTSETFSDLICKILNIAFGSSLLDRTMILSSALERLVLACLLFFLLVVAERTYKQRLLYAKFFSHLTSSRRARKSDLPHFRLNKVRNIKTWLSIRSYLKRRGPQRSVDVIVSSVFMITLALLSFVSLELIKDLDSLHCHYNIEALFWSFALGIFILRFMTLGTKINKKYRNISILITEQINLYLQIEQKPHKKDELMVANSVLKLAADLIKELESPFKISGLSANPYLYTITKVVLLSALSGVLSELLGFKLKLHKIKIK
ncbi:PREDICTED: putative homeodomain transcription factor [Ceratosolen solmsi marchali]|uniref:Homeodomain transcription factor n=1 Tax=Ceratosolen solmsi marchali TaxID=326594 RepID=A0AAJ7DW31_9HYME|nr:PREDICTED: putative homeodomain transcription factor [Ceratosolen solmsi marchali]